MNIEQDNLNLLKHIKEVLAKATEWFGAENVINTDSETGEVN